MHVLSGDLERMRRRKQELEREVANLANVVAQGGFSPTLRAALVDREREIGEIVEKLLRTESDSIQSRLRDIRARVFNKSRNVRAILNSDVLSVRAELAKHIDKITLNPNGDTYTASATWNFLRCGNIHGAGGPARTDRDICIIGIGGNIKPTMQAHVQGGRGSYQ